MVRSSLMKHRAAALVVVACALLARLLVPAGFMPMVEHGTISIVICTGYGPQTVQMDMPGMEMPGAGHKPGGGHHDKTESPCPFAGLSAPALSGADPILLAAAVRFVMLRVARRPVQPRVTANYRLRPPLRGPPAHV